MPVDPDMAKKLTRAGKRADDARADRDRLITEAVQSGGGVREVARLVGLSHPSVMAIVRKAQNDPDA